MTGLFTIGEGYRTYIISAVLILLVIVEKGLGIDIDGVEVSGDWLEQILAALGLTTLRASVANIKKDGAKAG
jgi:hypothetical protein